MFGVLLPIVKYHVLRKADLFSHVSLPSSASITTDVTIKQLREKLQELEGSFDKAVDAKVKERERQLNRQQAENERAQQGEQLALVTKLGSLEQEVATLQAALVRADEARHRYVWREGKRMSFIFSTAFVLSYRTVRRTKIWTSARGWSRRCRRRRR